MMTRIFSLIKEFFNQISEKYDLVLIPFTKVFLSELNFVV